METKTKYTDEEAYELALKWLPKIKRGLATNGELLNLASKIWKGEVTTNDLEAIIAPPEQ